MLEVPAVVSPIAGSATLANVPVRHFGGTIDPRRREDGFASGPFVGCARWAIAMTGIGKLRPLPLPCRSGLDLDPSPDEPAVSALIIREPSRR